jgi:hypothetical protein
MTPILGDFIVHQRKFYAIIGGNMTEGGNEEVVEYCVITLPKQGSVIDTLALRQELQLAYGEPVMIQGISSVATAYVFFSELADKASEIAYRENPSSEAFVIRSYLPKRYLHPMGVTSIMAPTVKKKNSTKKAPKSSKGKGGGTAEISLAKLWPEADTPPDSEKFKKLLGYFLETVGSEAADSKKIKITGDIPLAPALFALDLCWSLAKEIYYDETRLK